MLEVSEEVLEYLDKNEEVKRFNSEPYYKEKEAAKGKKISLIRCLESILGARDGKLRINEEGKMILEDGERSFILDSFHCGFPWDCAANIILCNQERGYKVNYAFGFDDRNIEACTIYEYIHDSGSLQESIQIINKEKDNMKLLDQVKRTIEKVERRRFYIKPESVQPNYQPKTGETSIQINDDDGR